MYSRKISQHNRCTSIHKRAKILTKITEELKHFRHSEIIQKCVDKGVLAWHKH